MNAKLVLQLRAVVAFLNIFSGLCAVRSCSPNFGEFD
jgi:hypothetical protein